MVVLSATDSFSVDFQLICAIFQLRLINVFSPPGSDQVVVVVVAVVGFVM